MRAEIEGLPKRPPVAGIEVICRTDPMKPDAFAEESVFTIPEFHAKKMYLMSATSEPGCKFPYTFFHPSFYVRIDDVVDKGDLHPVNLQMIIVLIEEHHTLEHSKEEHLDSGNNKNK